MTPFEDILLPQGMSFLKRLSQGFLTLSIAYPRTSSDLPATPSLSFSPSGSPVGLHDALSIYYTFVAEIPIH
jgi:hypothetical protein